MIQNWTSYRRSDTVSATHRSYFIFGNSSVLDLLKSSNIMSSGVSGNLDVAWTSLTFTSKIFITLILTGPTVSSPKRPLVGSCSISATCLDCVAELPAMLTRHPPAHILATVTDDCVTSTFGQHCRSSSYLLQACLPGLKYLFTDIGLPYKPSCTRQS